MHSVEIQLVVQVRLRIFKIKHTVIVVQVTGRGRKAKKKTKPLEPQGPSRYTEYSPPNTAPTQPRPKIP